MESIDFRNWRLERWNEALLNHVFGPPAIEFPIRSIPITNDFFSSAAGADESHADSARNSFLNIFKVLPISSIKALYNSNKALGGWTASSDSIPPFFAQLVLTLVVACELVPGSSSEDFRYRFKAIVGKPTAKLIPFENLGDYWLWLEAWLRATSLRTNLLLPAPGYENRIGYSKRLAFPNLKDSKELSNALNSEIDEDSPVKEILSGIQNRLDHFSQSFIHQYKDFRTIFLEGHYEKLYQHPFWIGITGVFQSKRREANSRVSKAKFGILLSLARPWNPEFSLIVNSQSYAVEKELDLLELESEESQWAIVFPPPFNAVQILESIIRGIAPEMVPEVMISWVSKHLAQGLLAFELNEFANLVATRYASENSAAFVFSETGWTKFESNCIGTLGIVKPRPIQGTSLLLLRGDGARTLSKWKIGSKLFSCLSARVLGPHISLHGLRTGRSFLVGKFLSLLAKCDDAEFLEMTYSDQDIATDKPLIITPVTEGGEKVFRVIFEGSELPPWPTSFNLCAVREGQRIASRLFSVVPRIEPSDLKGPKSNSEWLVEQSEGGLADKRNEFETLTIGCQSQPTPPNSKPNIKKRWLLDQKFEEVRSPASFESNKLSGNSEEFIEGLASLCARRAGVDYDDIHSIAISCFGTEIKYHLGDLINGLSDGLFLERAFSKAWNAIRFFPISPQLIDYKGPFGTRTVGIGLMCQSQRKRLEQSILASGGRYSYPTVIRSVGPVPISIFTGNNSAPSLAALTELGYRKIERTISDSISPVWDLISNEANREFIVPSNASARYFQRDSGKFEDSHQLHQSTIAELKYRDRPPEYFVLDESSRTIFKSQARNFAHLAFIGYGSPGQSFMFGLSAIQKSRVPFSLPTVIGRLCTLEGGIAPCLCRSENGEWAYFYDFRKKRLMLSAFGEAANSNLPKDETANIARWRKGINDYPNAIDRSNHGIGQVRWNNR